MRDQVPVNVQGILHGGPILILINPNPRILQLSPKFEPLAIMNKGIATSIDFIQLNLSIMPLEHTVLNSKRNFKPRIMVKFLVYHISSSYLPANAVKAAGRVNTQGL